MHRDLGAPLMVGDTVVFGDTEGNLHWLSRDKGEPLLRLSTDSSGIVAAPVASGTTMLLAVAMRSWNTIHSVTSHVRRCWR